MRKGNDNQKPTFDEILREMKKQCTSRQTEHFTGRSALATEQRPESCEWTNEFQNLFHSDQSFACYENFQDHSFNPVASKFGAFEEDPTSEEHNRLMALVKQHDTNLATISQNVQSFKIELETLKHSTEIFDVDPKKYKKWRKTDARMQQISHNLPTMQHALDSEKSDLKNNLENLKKMVETDYMFEGENGILKDYEFYELDRLDMNRGENTEKNAAYNKIMEKYPNGIPIITSDDMISTLNGLLEQQESILSVCGQIWHTLGVIKSKRLEWIGLILGQDLTKPSPSHSKMPMKVRSGGSSLSSLSSPSLSSSKPDMKSRKPIAGSQLTAEMSTTSLQSTTSSKKSVKRYLHDFCTNTLGFSPRKCHLLEP